MATAMRLETPAVGLAPPVTVVSPVIVSVVTGFTSTDVTAKSVMPAAFAFATKLVLTLAGSMDFAENFSPV